MPATDWKEVIPEDEAARFEHHAQVLGEMQRKRAPKKSEFAGGAVRQGETLDRALHAKANRGLEATFEVLGDLPEEARAAGMVAAPKTYSAFVRYSNGAPRHQPDRKADVRGFAVKVLGVAGKKLIPGLEDATTQDFLAIRTPVVPMRDADEFITLVRAAATPALLPIKLVAKLGFRRGIQVIKAALAGFKIPTAPLAATNYYSALPIKWGPYAVHFAFFAQDPLTVAAGKDPTFLGDELASRVCKSPVVYDFKIQFYRDPTLTPIEDASIEWRDSPYMTIGRLTLPVQDPTSPRGAKIASYIESLSFDPWHACADMRPLGNIMRARNAAYRVSTQARKAIAEPTAMPSFE